MLFLNPDTTNTLTVTWTERASTGDRYILRLTSIAKNTTTDFTLLKSANLSSYTNRYDQFQIAVGSIETGSYRYEVYDTNSTVTAALAVVETGLAFVQTATIGFNTYANTITYNTYLASSVRVFDSTFDSTFA
jgi:hypothetical protein